jgi:protein gp37
MTAIQWTNETWNPVAGCSIVSTECKNCYAMRQAHRLARMGQEAKYGGLTEKVNGHVVWNGVIRLAEEDLDKPLLWGKPRMVFVNSMSDLFHDGVPEEYIDRVFAVMALTQEHTFQILTKRPENMQAYCSELQNREVPVSLAIVRTPWWDGPKASPCAPGTIEDRIAEGPLPNVWLGTSVGYKPAKERIEYLRKTPAAVRFLSCEPLLEDLGELDLTGIHWVIIGGESGPGARPCSLTWIHNIIRQCREQNVKVFVKQLGAVPMEPEADWRGRVTCRLLSANNRFKVPEGFVPLKYQDKKAGEIAEWPEDLRVRQFPEVRG